VWNRDTCFPETQRERTGHLHLATHPAWEARQDPGVTAETKTTAGATVLVTPPPLLTLAIRSAPHAIDAAPGNLAATGSGHVWHARRNI